MSDTAWTATLGVLGIVGAIVSVWLGGQMSRNQAREQTAEARDARVRELAVDGYAAAVESTRWLSILHVEDSVNPRFVQEYQPKTDAAVPRLRYAATQFIQVSALSHGPELSDAAGQAAMALALLDEAWHDAQEYRRRLDESDGGTRPLSPKMLEFSKHQFDKNHQLLATARERLTGFDGSDLPELELEGGGIREGSLLHRIRTLTSAAKLA